MQDNKDFDKILKTEYSEDFDKKRKNSMVMSYYKYGPMGANYSGGQPNVDAIKSLEMRLEKYKETGNTDFLVDIANFAMIEFMYPQHKSAHYKAGADEKDSPGLHGMSVKEIERFREMGK